MAKEALHPPRNFEEEIVAQFVRDSGCVKKDAQAVLPPPESCPTYLKTIYPLAEIHLFSIIIIGIFLAAMMKLIIMSIKEH